MALSSCPCFGELSPAQKALALMMMLAVGFSCAMACPVISANDFSSAKNMQVRLVQALQQEGKYSAAATFLGAVDLNHVLPESSTILVPMDEGVAESGLQFSTFNTAMPILRYHVIVERLLFHDLQQLPVGQTFQTLLPNNTIIITNNSYVNFTLDDVLMSHQNLFVASSTVVHGMSGVLSSALYGRMTHYPDVQPSAPPAENPDNGSTASPGHQLPIPPLAGDGGSNNGAASPFVGNSSSNGSFSPFVGNSSANGTDSASFPPTISTNASGTPAVQAGNASSSSLVPPTSTPAPQAGNASSFLTPESLPFPSPPLEPNLNPPSSSDVQVPAVPAQQPSPLLQSSCGNDGDNCASASSHNVNFLAFYRFSLPAFLLSTIYVISPHEMRSVRLFGMILAMMVATPAKGDVAEVLRSKGGFDYAAAYLEAIDMHRVLPNRSTLLVPTDAVLEATGLVYNTIGTILPILQYHVITRELLFKDLQMLPVGEMLETMLPKASLLVTSNVPWNFTVNDVLLSHPDIICINGSALHGIAGVMNYSLVSNIPLPTNTGQLPVLAPPLPPLPVLAPPVPPLLTLPLPLPESAAPFAVPFPVSHANLIRKKMIGGHSTFVSVIILLIWYNVLIRSF